MDDPSVRAPAITIQKFLFIVRVNFVEVIATLLGKTQKSGLRLV